MIQYQNWNVTDCYRWVTRASAFDQCIVFIMGMLMARSVATVDVSLAAKCMAYTCALATMTYLHKHLAASDVHKLQKG